MPVPAKMGGVHNFGALRSYYRSHSRKAIVAKSKVKKVHGKTVKVKSKPKVAPKPIPPQNFIGQLSGQEIFPGVVYKHYHGKLNINVIEADLMSGALSVRPVLAGDSFNQLTGVREHAIGSHAIAAVNSNYFKRDGTPLGTLIIDNEWIAGPLYDRVSMGFTRSGYVRLDRVDLYGTLRTSNPEISSLWINNINQPRRHGSRLILYTRHWGSAVQMAYSGCLVSVDANGKVVDKQEQSIFIPNGGFVLSDSHTSAIALLNPGDTVNVAWHTRPDTWKDVVQAVSGGPMLVKNGRLYVDTADENFRKSWTGGQITARTSAGVTQNNHLLLVTVEGPHTMWDMAKFMKALGAVDAMNLDGGGSTTMVINGMTVTRNANSHQRKVASALAIIRSEFANGKARACAAAINMPSVLDNIAGQTASSDQAASGAVCAATMDEQGTKPDAGSLSVIK